eukprot:362032-Chlamydomonas_euryale.AAC.9
MAAYGARGSGGTPQAAIHTPTLSSHSTHVLEHVKANPAAVAHVEDVGVIVIEIGHQLDGWRVHRVVGRKLEVQMHHHALPAACEVWRAVWKSG